MQTKTVPLETESQSKRRVSWILVRSHMKRQSIAYHVKKGKRLLLQCIHCEFDINKSIGFESIGVMQESSLHFKYRQHKTHTHFYFTHSNCHKVSHSNKTIHHLFLPFLHSPKIPMGRGRSRRRPNCPAPLTKDK